MGQRRSALDLEQRRKARRQRRHVEKERRPPTHRCDWASAYRSPMGDASPAEDWPAYLRRMTSRPGWSVARLARESGVHRATIFGWIKGDKPNMASIHAIAEALGDDPVNAAAAAAGGAANPERLDADVQIILRRIENPTTPEAERATFRATLRYLAELAERASQDDQGESDERAAS